MTISKNKKLLKLKKNLIINVKGDEVEKKILNSEILNSFFDYGTKLDELNAELKIKYDYITFNIVDDLTPDQDNQLRDFFKNIKNKIRNDFILANIQISYFKVIVLLSGSSTLITDFDNDIKKYDTTTEIKLYREKKYINSNRKFTAYRRTNLVIDGLYCSNIDEFLQYIDIQTNIFKDQVITVENFINSFHIFVERAPCSREMIVNFKNYNMLLLEETENTKEIFIKNIFYKLLQSISIGKTIDFKTVTAVNTLLYINDKYKGTFNYD